MYYRSQGYRYPKDMRIPVNYGGNAFSDNEKSEEEITQTIAENQTESQVESEIDEESSEISEIQDEAQIKDTPKAESASTSSIFHGFGRNSFFSGIGSEELLILALVFLLSDNESDNDIVWLLLLLLFIK